MRRLLLLAAVVAGALAAAGTAGATRECNGLQVCVPVAGPWVMTPGRAETQWQLACPKKFIVGGLDAELTSRALDLAFRATLGSPVNPGITTSTAAVFLGRLVAGRGTVHQPAQTERRPAARHDVQCHAIPGRAQPGQREPGPVDLGQADRERRHPGRAVPGIAVDEQAGPRGGQPPGRGPAARPVPVAACPQVHTQPPAERGQPPDGG